MFPVPIFSSNVGVDVGDIGHSLRFRGEQSITRTITTDATSTYFAAIKRGKLGVITPIFDTNIKFNANDTITAFGLTTTAVFRDPTSWLFIHVSNGGLYVNGVSYGAVTTSSITNPRIGYDGTNYADMCVARIGAVGGSSSSYTNFGYLNSEINEWVTKTQAQVKAVVDAGGTNSFMLDFDDGSSLTTLGYDLHGANLLTYSQDFTNEAWYKTGCTVTPNTVTAPDSTLTADTALFSALSNHMYQTLASNVSVYHTASIYIKAITASSILLVLTFDSGGAYNNCSVDFNPATGVLGTPSSYGAIISGATATALSNGWWRVSLTGKSSDTANTYVALQLYCLSSAYSCYVWGAQLERGTTASPYKVTTTAAKPHNDWTLNNFSLTAGPTYDWMLDVPGNSYATLNPLYKLISPPIQANLAFTSGAGWRMQKGPELNTDKWYVECVWTSVGASNASNLGLILPSTAIDVTHYAGMTSTSWGLVISSTYAYVNTNAAAIFTQAGTYNAASTGKLAVDFDAGKCWIGYNDSWFGGGDPAAGTSPTVTFTPNTAYCIGMGVNANTTHFVSGAAPLQTGATYQTAAGGYFTRAVPAGFKALCQANMPEPAIKNPERHMDVVLATGANIKSTTESVFPSNFLEWIKDRANSNNHQLIDTVRGTSAVLQSNTTAAETTYSAPSGSSVGWLWKAGGAAVINNAGSIQSQVSANVEAGFSIVTYTGTGANATVGHGLGKAPGLVIAKGKNYSGVNSNWLVNDASAPWTKALTLNTTNATITDSSFYNNTAPTSSVFTLGSNPNLNANTYQYVAYYFAEVPGYSKIGSYTGNGSTDGPYVECGFKPRFVMIKSSTAADDWKIYDAARPGYNVQGGNLKANTTGVETVAAEIDFTASGFKLRVATTPNAAQTYIFIAFADVPAKYSLSR